MTGQYASPMGGKVPPMPGTPGEQPAALIDAFAVVEQAMKDG